MTAKASTRVGPLALLSKLVDCGNVDTVYRDVYLGRGRTLLAKEFPLEEFRRTEQQGGELAGSPLRRTAGTRSPPGRLHRLHTEGARSVRADGQAVAGARRWPR